MMVTFVSQCEKKALNRTRRVLDAFADRIGDNTWQTVITLEGLNAVKKLLRKTASKSTAVSCHWVRSRSRTELMWVVGNKAKFNAEGRVPVNSTVVNRPHRDDRADWHYLPVIRSLTALAALLHDWGKANERFQQKLTPGYKGTPSDPLRHEWVSCLLIKALIVSTDSNDDTGWLNLLNRGEIKNDFLEAVDFKHINKPLEDLPPIAQLITWLVATHHKLPVPVKDKMEGRPCRSLQSVLSLIDQEWGYRNESAGTIEDCLRFSNGMLSNADAWLKPIKRWAGKLLEQRAQIEQAISNGSYRLILHHARLCLMLGDHYYSSLDIKDTGKWNNTSGLIANTQKSGEPKQALDQHLIGVYKSACKNINELPKIESHLTRSDNTALLRKKSPGEYAWQDKATRKIHEWKKRGGETRQGFFAVNMASTGCGKTLANAKVMMALSGDNTLRFILALGLRTLTLQTGDEYRERIFKNSDGSDLAVLIGSKAISELHEEVKSDREAEKAREQGSESQETLLAPDDHIDYESDVSEEGLATILQTTRDKKFLHAPVLACTIDHIIAATETVRGGRYILPALRLLSSDLIIDEIDDFTGGDLIAIGRLIQLAGMLGRKVMISSATIPPALAEGYFNAYSEGWSLFCKTRNASQAVGCAWIDEFSTHIADINIHGEGAAKTEYAQKHSEFIDKRVENLSRELAKRRADIIDCQSVLDMAEVVETSLLEAKQAAYFNAICQAVLVKHKLHSAVDSASGLNISFGVVRMANISPCVELVRFLLSHDWPADTEVRVMAYHSQQVLLLRHEQEKHLDSILKRKEKSGEEPAAFSNNIIRNHINLIEKQSSSAKNTIFIVVATPVEEVGRDHDFDWAIIEPSSYRSIIQMAGRVRRHRKGETTHPNIGILQYNWRTIDRGEEARKPRFCWPGYETQKPLHNDQPGCMKSHDLNKVVDTERVAKRLDAIPRIQEVQKKSNTPMAKLEHAVTASLLTHYNGEGPDTLQGYLAGCWYLTALSQKNNRFRHSPHKSIHLFRVFDSKGNFYFTEKDDCGEIKRTLFGDIREQDDEYRIHNIELDCVQVQRLWLFRDYQRLLEQKAEQENGDIEKIALKFGELVFQEPFNNSKREKYFYNDQLGLFKDKRGD